MTDNEIKSNIVIYSAKQEYSERAVLLAKHLKLETVNNENNCVMLRIDDSGLVLTYDGLTLRGDFTRLLPRIRQSNLGTELVVKAAKIKSFGSSPTAVDATAGLGEDSFLLAAAGFNVTLYEHNPIIAALLSDALQRAKNEPEISTIANRMTLIEENSIDALRNLSYSPDLILLDPMFPERQKSSLVKKKLQLIQLLEKPCSSEEELLKSAISASPKKIIIKRPSKGAYLAGVKPSYQVERKSIRYDCIVLCTQKK